ncbi:hypothetical protein F4556_004240 [Kitasatospora gansuensis]|uniref:DUF2304 domain-containing protein n=1 Tax=Kitasatospora gansuensis TaxID=258050 RepID=A0A7W7WJA1_9ACTN|nr:DUF2304 domain-containing protein [Kitasatospora gansuensis]MBB4948705.1 hypothetical protein [Kitasatospora gansuensis]
MQLSILTSITGLLVLGYILELLRRQQLREKYAAIWLAIGLLVAPLGFVPDLLDSTARRLGVASGASLVLFAGFVLILLVSLHLSWETSRLEAETRTLAEDVALIRAHLVQQGNYPMADRAADASAADATEAQVNS